MPTSHERISHSWLLFVENIIQNARSARPYIDDDIDRTSLQTQFQKHLWCQFLILDLVVAEARGSQPTYDMNDWNIFPLNVRDDELAIAESSSIWTESTFSLIRNECYKVHRGLIQARQNIRLGRTSPNAAAKKLTDEKRRIEEKILGPLDNRIPIQRCAKLIGRTFLAAFEFVLLQESAFHNYVLSEDRNMWQFLITDR